MCFQAYSNCSDSGECLEKAECGLNAHGHSPPPDMSLILHKQTVPASDHW